MLVSPYTVAARYRAEIRQEIRSLGKQLKVVGLLAGDYAPSLTYAEYTKNACEDLGITYELRQAPRLDLEQRIVRGALPPTEAPSSRLTLKPDAVRSPPTGFSISTVNPAA